MEIGKYLISSKKDPSKAEVVASKDKTIFEKWASGSISTVYALDAFKHNNKIKVDIISTWEFERWLNELGYFRKKNR